MMCWLKAVSSTFFEADEAVTKDLVPIQQVNHFTSSCHGVYLVGNDPWKWLVFQNIVNVWHVITCYQVLDHFVF